MRCEIAQLLCLKHDHRLINNINKSQQQKRVSVLRWEEQVWEVGNEEIGGGAS